MAVSSRFRIAAIALSAAVAGALLLALLTHDGADASPAKPSNDQARFLLRLTDLPPGYSVLPIGSIGNEGDEPDGPDMPCGKIRPAEPVPKLAEFIAKYSPSGCFAAYVRAYRTPVPGPNPLLAGSGVLDAGSVAAAKAGFEVAPQLLGHFIAQPQVADTTTTVGDASMLLHITNSSIFKSDELGSYLVWRSGSVLGVVLATGRSQAANDRDALALALLQQPHLEHPTPYTPAERDDSEVSLDNPALKRPVYWLGRSFAPGAGLPRIGLSASGATPGGADGSRQHVALLYGRGLYLSVWTMTDWSRRAGRSAPGYVPSRRCAQTKTVDLAQGHAIVYGTYADKRGPCPDGPPRVYLAHSFIGKSVITAEVIATCAGCAGPGTGPYNSERGMEAVVRALKLRPKPVF